MTWFAGFMRIKSINKRLLSLLLTVGITLSPLTSFAETKQDKYKTSNIVSEYNKDTYLMIPMRNMIQKLLLKEELI